MKDFYGQYRILFFMRNLFVIFYEFHENFIKVA